MLTVGIKNSVEVFDKNIAKDPEVFILIRSGEVLSNESKIADG